VGWKVLFEPGAGKSGTEIVILQWKGGSHMQEDVLVGSSRRALRGSMT